MVLVSLQIKAIIIIIKCKISISMNFLMRRLVIGIAYKKFGQMGIIVSCSLAKCGGRGGGDV